MPVFVADDVSENREIVSFLLQQLGCDVDAVGDGRQALITALDAKRGGEAYDVIMAELRRMKKRKLTVTALDKVKAQVKGHLTLGMGFMTLGAVTEFILVCLVVECNGSFFVFKGHYICSCCNCDACKNQNHNY